MSIKVAMKGWKEAFYLHILVCALDKFDIDR